MQQTIKDYLVIFAIFAIAWFVWRQNDQIKQMNDMWRDSVQVEVQYLKQREKYERVWEAERSVIEKAQDDCLDKSPPDAVNRVFMVDPKLPD